MRAMIGRVRRCVAVAWVLLPHQPMQLRCAAKKSSSENGSVVVPSCMWRVGRLES